MGRKIMEIGSTELNPAYFEVIQTARLTLRRFRVADGEVVERLLNDREIASNTRSIDYPYPKGAASIWIDSQFSKWESGDCSAFAICQRQTDQLIGGIGLEIEKSNHNAELGYWLGREFWNQGYCTEAARVILDHGFDQLGLHRIHCHYLTRNPASGRVMEKIGMKREGLLRGHARKWGVFEDVVIYGMLATDPRTSP
jgi:RimJ/RimL family protein N-acetyltransferase